MIIKHIREPRIEMAPYVYFSNIAQIFEKLIGSSTQFTFIYEMLRPFFLDTVWPKKCASIVIAWSLKLYLLHLDIKH